MKWLAVLTLAGCTQVFGLDDTRSVDPDKDRDHDGVEDGDDNCPDIANNEQKDADHDGIGDECDHCDACAPCATAVNHDEDGDRLDDACDNCPAVGNAGQENLDGDDVGDVCDVDNAVANRRLFFDGFGTLSDAWLQGGAPWTIVNDATGPSPGLPSPPYILRRDDMFIAAGSSYVIELGISPETIAGGIYLRSKAGQATVHCALLALFPGPQWQMVSGSGVTSGTFDVQPNMRLRITLRDANVRCEIVDLHTHDSTVNPLYPYNFDIQATGKVTFSYVDVMSP